MVEIFKQVDKFFTSLTNYLTYNYIFIAFVGLFLVTILGVIIGTSRAYEARLIKAIDKLNSYFIDNPYINDENLVSFNEKMKSKAIPKQLRKYWQQFVLYRENKASTYMSFENCVSNPIRTSTYTRDVKLMTSLAWIFSMCALILNCYYCFETVDIAAALRGVLLTPIVILLLNYFVQIFLNLRHNAIVSDLFQNYQYFEVNIDKATSTLPEYVDYEVLFDRNEIKKGIPILYAYLQKRAEEEQRELERARLRNVEHEKFNFDDQGIAGSLVLERALQEAENYIAERKKYTQDIGQINADITQEDMNYREITKEYNRQMQVSKETFANFKAQLEEVTSTIEANYLKKQQQQELDRQRNLERDYDAATERHNKVIESYQEELKTIEGFIAQSRVNLENAMKSEFGTYNDKVYDEARKVVDEREKDKHEGLKQSINKLEEELFAKNQELEQLYQDNQVLNEQLIELGAEVEQQLEQNKQGKSKKVKEQVKEVRQEPVQKVVETPVHNEAPAHVEELIKAEEPVQEVVEEPVMTYEEYRKQLEAEKPVERAEENILEETSASQEEKVEPVEAFEQSPNVEIEEETNKLPEEVKTEEIVEPEEFDFDFEIVEPAEEPVQEQAKEIAEEPVMKEPVQEVIEKPIEEVEEEKEAQEVKTEEIVAEEAKNISTDEGDDSIKQEQASRRGRPRKVVDASETKGEKKPVGRPRKEKPEGPEEPKKPVGRPRKERPEGPEEPKKPVGRPRKSDSEKPVKKSTKGRGRPRKEATVDITEIKDIDEYLKEIDSAIAAENAKLEETQKELAKKTKLKRKK